MTTFAAKLEAAGHLLLDGAMGTELFARGLTSGDNPELWNVERPDDVAAVHRDYLQAGSDIVLTNTFGGSRFRLALHGLDDRVGELNAAGAAVARRAVEAAGTGALVAGSMGQSGELIEPLGPRTVDEMTDAFTAQAAALASGGADIVWIETFSAIDEIRAAVAGARAGAPKLPVVVTMSFDTAGRSMMGVRGAELAALAENLELDAFGANCGNNLAETESALREAIEGRGDRPVVSKANAGIPVWSDGGLVYDGSPEIMAAHAYRTRELGARLIGACCGSTPMHLAEMRAVLEGDKPPLDLPAPGPPPVDTDDAAQPRAPRRNRRGRGVTDD